MTSSTHPGRGDVEERANVLLVVEDRIGDDRAVALVRASARGVEAERVAYISAISLCSALPCMQDVHCAPQTFTEVEFDWRLLSRVPCEEMCGAAPQWEVVSLTL